MRKVYITGVGCITPIGNDIETLWNSLINGVCGIDFITKIDVADLPVFATTTSMPSMPLPPPPRPWPTAD